MNQSNNCMTIPLYVGASDKRKLSQASSMCVRACVHACVRACVRAWVGAWVRGCVGAWVGVCVCVFFAPVLSSADDR